MDRSRVGAGVPAHLSASGVPATSITQTTTLAAHTLPLSYSGCDGTESDTRHRSIGRTLMIRNIH